MTISIASPILAAFARGQRQRQNRSQSTPSTDVPESDGQSINPISEPTHSNATQSTNPVHVSSVANKPVKGAHRTHNVLTVADRIRIVQWMCDEAKDNGNKHIPAKAVRQFPSLFRGTEKANLQRASRLWKGRESFINDEGNVVKRVVTSSVTGMTKAGFKRVYMKARKGRGRKVTPWVLHLHRDLLLEFDRLRKLGVKFNCRTLRHLAIALINESSGEDYYKDMVDLKAGKKIIDMITPRWVQSFTNRHHIVSRAQTGKLLLSPEKEMFREKEVAYHLGKMARQFRNGEIDENHVENADETHFVINMDNGRTLGFSGEIDVKYADVVSGGGGYDHVSTDQWWA